MKRVIYDSCCEFYSVDESANAIDTSIIKNKLEREHPKHSSVINHMIDALKSVSVPNVLADYIEHKKEISSGKLAEALINKDSKAVNKYLEEFNKFKQADETIFDEDDGVLVAPSLKFITEAYDEKNLIPIWPASLNERLGGGYLLV